MKRLIVFLAMVFALLASVIPVKAEYAVEGGMGSGPSNYSPTPSAIIGDVAFLWRPKRATYGLMMSNYEKDVLVEYSDGLRTSWYTKSTDVSLIWGYWSNRRVDETGRKGRFFGWHTYIGAGPSFMKVDMKDPRYKVSSETSWHMRLELGTDFYLMRKPRKALSLSLSYMVVAIISSDGQATVESIEVNPKTGEKWIYEAAPVIGVFRVGLTYWWGGSKAPN